MYVCIYSLAKVDLNRTASVLSDIKEIWEVVQNGRLL